jgi:hypothetical protein
MMRNQIRAAIGRTKYQPPTRDFQNGGRSWRASAAMFARLEMHGDENDQEIQERRHKGGNHHIRICDLDPFSHNEGDGPHDRRQDHAPGRSNRLDRPGKGRPISNPDHHWNGEHACRCRIRGRRAGYRTEQRTGQDCRLGRSAAAPASQRQGDVDEPLPCPGRLHDGAKDKKDDYDIRRNVQRQPEDTAFADIGAIEKAFQRIALAVQQPGKIALEYRHQHEGQDDDRQRPSGGAAYRLDQRNRQTQGNNDAWRIEFPIHAVVAIGLEKQNDVADANEGHRNQDIVVPGDFRLSGRNIVAGSIMRGAGAAQNENKDQRTCDAKAEMDLARHEEAEKGRYLAQHRNMVDRNDSCCPGQRCNSGRDLAFAGRDRGRRCHEPAPKGCIASVPRRGGMVAIFAPAASSAGLPFPASSLLLP